MDVFSCDVAELLEKYFDAAANLYGIIRLSKILDIYNSQNEPISEDVFLDFAEKLEEKHKFFTYVGEDEMFDDVDETKPINRDLVAEYIAFDIDEGGELYYEIKESQIGKTYYVPERETLLKYSDDDYVEKSMAFIDFRAFIRNLPQFTREKADEFVLDLYLAANIFDGSSEDLAHYLAAFGFDFEEDVLKEMVPLYSDMHRDIRLHIYCGHTFNEMLKTNFC